MKETLAGIGLTGLAWRLAETMPLAERRDLALRLIETDAEEIVFRRNGLAWIAPAWDGIITRVLFAYGSFQGAEMNAVVHWMKRHRRITSKRDVIIEAAGASTDILLLN